MARTHPNSIQVSRVNAVSAVNLKIQKRQKIITKLKMFHLKSTDKNQHFCFPNSFYLHKLCHPIEFLLGREDEREQGEPCTFRLNKESFSSCWVPCGIPIYLEIHRSDSVLLKRQTSHIGSACLLAIRRLPHWSRLRTAVLFQARFCWEFSTPASCHCASPEATGTLHCLGGCISSLTHSEDKNPQQVNFKSWNRK